MFLSGNIHPFTVPVAVTTTHTYMDRTALKGALSGVSLLFCAFGASDKSPLTFSGRRHECVEKEILKLKVDASRWEQLRVLQGRTQQT